MPKNNPSDYEARVKIENELNTNFLVEAGAGSGKTTSLIRRMVSLLKSGDLTVGKIAAITFTRKAAGELRERFQTELEKTCREAKDSHVKDRLQQALIDLDQCFLGTIHSFCASLLRERPVEAKLDPAFKELDAMEETSLKDQAWEGYLLEIKLNTPQHITRLEDIGIATLDMKSAFSVLSQYPDVILVSEETPKPELSTAFETLKLLVCQARKALPDQEPEKGWDPLQKVILKAERFIRFFNLEQEINIVSLLKLFDRQLEVTQNRWNSKDEAKQYRDEFNVFAEATVAPILQAWREYCHHILMEFLIPAVNYYEQARFKHSTLNFQDLLLKTRNMLRENPEVRDYFHSKYPRLLVDEFQDTDPVQAEIIFYLTGQDVNERDWHRLLPYPCALFVVGDPKQSIYRFRRADIDTYNLVKKLIQQSGGDVLKLTANFRSVQVLGEVLNPIFQRVFPDHETSHQAEFSPLETLRPNGTEAVVGLRLLTIPAEYKNKEEIFAEDAERIARYIRWALDGNISLAHPGEQPGVEVMRKPEPKDFMILLRFKDGMDTYARALEKYGIPLSMTGGTSIGDSLELAELFKLLRVLANPDDQVLMVGVLRGLFFGFSDDELYQIKKANGHFNLYSPVPEGIDDNLTTKYAHALNKLKEYLYWTRQMLPTVAITKLITDLGLIPYTLGLSNSQSRTAYFYQVLELLRQTEINGKTRFDQIIAEFGVILSGTLEDEISLTAKEENAVRLMNLHKAKGLEAPVVFLAQPYKAVSQRAEIHIKRQGTEPRGYFVFSHQRGFQSECLAQPVGWDEYENEELKYLREEENRLVYVAATRSKNLLVVSRSLKDKVLKKNPWVLLLEEPSADIELLVSDIDVKSDQGAVTKTKVEQGEFVTAREQLTKWVATQAKPTYQTKSPTGLKEPGIDFQIKREAGGGKAWGLVIHKVFEELVNGNSELTSVIELALEKNGVAPERKVEVLGVVEAFRRSDLWQRISDAEAKYTEVPFTQHIGPEHPLYTQMNGEHNLPIVLSGVIDLVFKEPAGGWVIVDFKTDRVVEAEDLNTLTNFYSPQVKMYCQVWQELSDQECNMGGIYFVEKQQLKQIQL